MTLTSYLAFIAASATLALLPGPNVALIIANSLSHGVRHGLLSVAGTASAMLPQMILTLVGLSALLSLPGSWLDIARGAGVVYLLYLGLRQWCSPPSQNTQKTPNKNHYKSAYWQGFMISATNPKTLLFYAAFFPQFISETHSVTGQIAILCATFITVVSLIDAGWAALAGYAAPRLSRSANLHGKISGTFLILAACGLALARHL